MRSAAVNRVCGRDAIEDQDPIQVIEFVLDGARLDAGAPFLRSFKAQVDALRPLHVRQHARQALAALPPHLLAGSVHDQRVDEHQQAVVRLCRRMAGDVHHGHPHRVAYLGGGQTPAARQGTHGVNQVGSKPLGQIRISRRTQLLQQRVGIGDDRPDQRTSRSSGCSAWRSPSGGSPARSAGSNCTPLGI